MSRKGNCWDNAVMERFFLNLKMECLWQRRYANPLEAARDIDHYRELSAELCNQSHNDSDDGGQHDHGTAQADVLNPE